FECFGTTSSHRASTESLSKQCEALAAYLGFGDGGQSLPFSLSIRGNTVIRSRQQPIGMRVMSSSFSSLLIGPGATSLTRPRLSRVQAGMRRALVLIRKGVSRVK